MKNPDDRRPPCRTYDRKYGKTADHNNVTMGEIQHLCNSVNHGVTKGNDSIYTSKTDPVD